MSEPYKIQIELAGAKFTGEGPEASVREDYQHFLDALREVRSPETFRQRAFAGTADKPPANLTDRVYKIDGDVVSLRLLPPEGPTRAADTAILVLYGYHQLQALDDIPVTKLNEGLRKSGISLQRIDRIISVHEGLFMKGGARVGGRYTLNNQGITQAEKWLNQWFN